MKRLLVMLFAMLVLGAIASPAYATAVAGLGTGGWIEVCKAPNPALNGTFRFTISDNLTAQWPGTLDVSLAAGNCTAPIAVKPGNVSVTEQGSSLGMDDGGATVESKEFLGTPTSTAVGATDGLGANPKTGFSRTDPVPAGDSSKVVKVTFSNTLTTGVIEVCKLVKDPSLTGTWAFTVTGGNGFTTTTSTTPGSCSPAITLPAGHFKVVETGNSPSNAESVTAITAVNQSAGNVAKTVNLPAATVVATVDVGDSSKQTITTFTNNLVAFKLCKNYTGGTSPVTSYPFTLSTVAGGAGPNTPPATVSVAPGTCKDLGYYRAGTRVLVTEGITPGTKVGTIAANQGIVTGTLNRPDRSVQVDLLAGETVLTYTDVPALDGLLKICKATTLDSPVIPAGTVFSFSLTGGGTPLTVTVTAGAPGTTQCSQPVTSKFDATWTVTEAARPNTTVTAITANLTKVVVVDNGTPTNTSQDVLTAVNLAARSANVTIGENNTTELTFTNKDPIDVPPVGSGGGSSGGGSSSSVITPVGGVTLLTPVAPLTPPVVTINKSASAKAALTVTQLKHQLVTLKKTQARLHKAFLAAKTKAAKRVLTHRIAVVNAQVRKINSQLKLLS